MQKRAAIGKVGMANYWGSKGKYNQTTLYFIYTENMRQIYCGVELTESTTY